MNTYQIFDVNSPLMADYPLVQAKSNADAAKKYCKDKYPKHTAKASGCNFVHISVKQCVEENGKRYLIGGKRTTWFKLIEKGN